jgi:hypothetical protein
MSVLPRITKADGTKEFFEPEKLMHSLVNARADQKIAEEIVEKINKEIRDGMTTSQIYERAFDLLNSRSKKTAMKYSIRRSILNLGPTGFPFEKYVSEIFKAKGYETRTGQIVQGKCIEHEVDMLAWNDKEVIVSEIKFHNELSAKSDTKVALYVKARFDDLVGQKIKLAGKEREIKKGILITNTKFTDNAKDYAECVGNFEMISWDYPKKDNLFDFIEETKMHPVTVIPILSKKNQQDLINNGIVNCMSLKDKRAAMKTAGIPDSKIDEIVQNIDNLCVPE